MAGWIKTVSGDRINLTTVAHAAVVELTPWPAGGWVRFVFVGGGSLDGHIGSSDTEAAKVLDAIVDPVDPDDYV